MQLNHPVLRGAGRRFEGLRSEDTPVITESQISSRLLTELFAGYSEDDQITVLDLGPGNSATVNFLANYRVKVYFADLLSHSCLPTPPEDATPETIANSIAQQLAIPAGTPIDICLLWDYLHYIDLRTMEALSQVLEPMLHKNSRGYGFGTLHGNKPDDANMYGIASMDALATRPMTNEPDYMAHSQQRLGEHFAALRISRGTLLRQGRLELLFEAS